MKKEGKIITVILAVVFLAAVVLIWSNKNALQVGQTDREQAILTVQVQGQTVAQLTWEQIQSLPATEFAATVKSSGKKPHNLVYTGVDLTELVKYCRLDLSGMGKLVATSADGYVVAADLEQILIPGNAYLAYGINGQAMAGRSQKGEGPYQIIFPHDAFSQRWAKYLLEVDFQ